MHVHTDGWFARCPPMLSPKPSCRDKVAMPSPCLNPNLHATTDPRHGRDARVSGGPEIPFPAPDEGSPSSLWPPLEALRVELLNLVSPFLCEYVWHRDAFDLVDGTARPPPWLRKQARRRQMREGGEEASKAEANERRWGGRTVGRKRRWGEGGEKKVPGPHLPKL
jgi:hypothetical protein